MRISDWSSDVCSSDLGQPALPIRRQQLAALGDFIDVIGEREGDDIGFEPIDDRARLLARAAVRLLDRQHLTALRLPRSDDRRVGKECVSTVRARGVPYPTKKQYQIRTEHTTIR